MRSDMALYTDQWEALPGEASNAIVCQVSATPPRAQPLMVLHDLG
jgi:hypothetical protein